MPQVRKPPVLESRAKIWYQLNAFKPPVAYTAVRSTAVVLLLLNQCLLLLPLFVVVLCLVLVLFTIALLNVAVIGWIWIAKGQRKECYYFSM